MGSLPSTEAVAAPTLPPEAFWIPRLMCEMEAPFVCPDAAEQARLDALARGVAALATLAWQPWALAAMQRAVFSLLLAHCQEQQLAWMGAWRRCADAATHGHA